VGRRLWRDHGRIATLVVLLAAAQAQRFARDGALAIGGDVAAADVLLLGCGAYQLAAALRARARLGESGIGAAVIALAEPGRLRTPRDETEAAATWTDAEITALFPPRILRVVVTHTRPESFLGALRRIDTGPATTRALGYLNRGGTFDVEGMLFANRCTWAHVVEAAALVLGRKPEDLLRADELAAVQSRGAPDVLR
jgi:phosphoketolase